MMPRCIQPCCWWGMAEGVSAAPSFTSLRCYKPKSPFSRFYWHFCSDLLQPPLAEAPVKGDIEGYIGGVWRRPAWLGIFFRRGG